MIINTIMQHDENVFSVTKTGHLKHAWNEILSMHLKKCMNEASWQKQIQAGLDLVQQAHNLFLTSLKKTNKKTDWHSLQKKK